MTFCQFLFKCVIVVLLLCCMSRAADLGVPHRIQQKIDEAIVISGDTSVPSINPGAFRRALNAISGELSPSLLKAAAEKEWEGINAKMVVLASAMARDTSHFEEIEKYYIYDGVKNALKGLHQEPGAQYLPVIAFAPALKPEHLTPDFRLAWECFMMILWVPDALPDFSDRISQALVEIGDPRSAVVIEYRYKASASDPRADPRKYNDILVQLPSQTALRALLKCVEEWDRQADVRRRNAEQFAGLVIRSPADPSPAFQKLRLNAKHKADAWRRVIQAAAGTTPAQRKILASIKGVLRAEE